ncbi:MAG: LysR substrate-binding domain-containing protein [Pseudomonadota bacterium]
MRRLDLNLLYIMREMLKEPNTTRVAERLGMTQSAVSAAISRLRWAFEDELFVRSGRGMAPTPKAESLGPKVDHIIQQLEKILEEVHFEPSTLKRTFSIISGEFLIRDLAGPLLKALEEAAPRVSLHFAEQSTEDIRERIMSGHLDLAIGPYPEAMQLENRLNFQKFYRDRLVAVVCAKSGRYGDTLSEGEFFGAPHLVVNPTGGGSTLSTTQIMLQERELRPRVVSEFKSHLSAAYALAGTDALAILPERLLRQVDERIRLKTLDLPIQEFNFDVGMLWSQRYNSIVEHQWFRDLVAGVAEQALDLEL